MPLYSFSCANCDWSRDKLFNFSSRPNEIDCEKCTGVAIYTIAVSEYQGSTPKYRSKRYSSDKRGLSMHEFKCVECGNSFDEIVDHSVGQSTQDNFDCPECGASGCAWRPSSRIDRWSERFPYFDRGLGVWLKSKAHRKRICKERGLEPVDGDYDEEKIFSEFDSKREKEKAEYATYVDRLDNAPEFASYRRAVDQGRA